MLRKGHFLVPNFRKVCMENKKFLIVADIHGSELALDETLRIANELFVDKIVIESFM